MQKDTWTIIGVIVMLVGLLATLMVTSLASIESRLTAMETHFSERLAVMDDRLGAMDNRLAAMDNRLAAMDGRLHEINTRLSRIEGHLGLPAEVEPIQFQTIGLALPSPAIDLTAPAGNRRRTGAVLRGLPGLSTGASQPSAAYGSYAAPISRLLNKETI